jgi:hypothetical protein
VIVHVVDAADLLGKLLGAPLLIAGRHGARQRHFAPFNLHREL